MNTFVIMFVVAPVHFWEEPRPVQVPGWASIEACQAAAPEFTKRYGAINRKTETYFLRPWKNKEYEEFVPARVECVAMPNSSDPAP